MGSIGAAGSAKSNGFSAVPTRMAMSKVCEFQLSVEFPEFFGYLIEYLYNSWSFLIAMLVYQAG